jgi:hypothetical protein
MSRNLKRLSLANARLETLTRTEADFRAQFLELMKVREQVRTALHPEKQISGAGLRSCCRAGSREHGKIPQLQL